MGIQWDVAGIIFIVAAYSFVMGLAIGRKNDEDSRPGAKTCTPPHLRKLPRGGSATAPAGKGE